mgnify:CR=1 FL=1
MPEAEKVNLTGKHLVLIDGVCVLCHGFVRFIHRHDKNNLFYFGALQDAKINAYLKNSGKSINVSQLKTVVVIRDYNTPKEQCLIKSNAGLFIVSKLAWWVAWLRIVKIIPRVLRDVVYDSVAKVRYRMFGVKDHCEWAEGSLRNNIID